MLVPFSKAEGELDKADGEGEGEAHLQAWAPRSHGAPVGRPWPHMGEDRIQLDECCTQIQVKMLGSMHQREFQGPSFFMHACPSAYASPWLPMHGFVHLPFPTKELNRHCC